MEFNYSLIPSEMPKRINAKIAFTIIALGSCFSSAEDILDPGYSVPAQSINVLFEDDSVNAIIRESTQSVRSNMLVRLSHFFNTLNEENWDEYGAYPIERQSYENAISVVNNTSEEVLKLWNVFPSPNGTISFEFKAREIAAMSVGNKDFSFVARRRGDREVLKNKTRFVIKDAVRALEIMSKHLGYLK